jgi:organic hydroperoxide reductase OsmC/OhrA
MSEHKINLIWQRNTPDFNYKTYDRAHTIRFSGGATTQVTAAPEFLGSPALANPEELLVAALSSCHMLTFLALAAFKGLVVDNYADEAVGVLSKNSDGKMAVTEVILRPQIMFRGNQPDTATLHQLHEKAHKECFIANSVKTEVRVEMG